MNDRVRAGLRRRRLAQLAGWAGLVGLVGCFLVLLLFERRLEGHARIVRGVLMLVPGSVALHGKPLAPGASYRVTVNSFNAAGGDGLTVLREGRDVVRGGAARQALERYVQRHTPVAPPTERRARNVGND